MNWAEENRVISVFQAGFQKNRSTIDHILVLDTLVQKQLNKKRGTLYGAFIDLKKAFDSLRRDYLWEKLKEIGISKKMLRILISMYDGVRANVRLGKNQVSGN